jgi:hypothetical protein
MSGAWVALLLALGTQPQPERIVVTAGGTLDAQRLSDALRVYLGELGMQIETAPSEAAGDIRARMTADRQLGESVRALAVVHAAGDSPDAVEIELDDLTTQKTLIASVPRPPRDEDLYRTLALKIQALLRATLSEARGSLDPRSAAGRLAADETLAASPASDNLSGRLALEVGYQALSLAAAGVTLQGLSAVGSWKLGRRFDVALGTAALGSTRLSANGVVAVAQIVPLFAAARVRWRWSRIQLMAGPSAELAMASVTAVSDTVPVRSSRDMIVALGGQAELRLELVGPFGLYGRADALGVVDAPAYDAGGSSILDTSRLHLAFSAGLGLVFP